jgi:hypothetical protein
MKSIAVIAVTGALALLLTACGGDKGESKPADTTSMEQTEGNKDESMKANEAAPAAQPAAPAEGQQTQPTEGQH